MVREHIQMLKHKKNKKLIYNVCFLKIKPTISNIFISITDIAGNVIVKSSSGVLGFKGRKKKSKYVGNEIINQLLYTLKKKSIVIKLLVIEIKTFLFHFVTRPILTTLAKKNIKSIFYVNYKYLKSHNGIRLKKKRRV